MAVREGEDAIRRGKKPSIPKELSSYLQVVKDGSSWAIRYNHEAWQEAVDNKGFRSIASSEDFGPAETILQVKRKPGRPKGSKNRQPSKKNDWHKQTKRENQVAQKEAKINQNHRLQ